MYPHRHPIHTLSSPYCTPATLATPWEVQKTNIKVMLDKLSADGNKFVTETQKGQKDTKLELMPPFIMDRASQKPQSAIKLPIFAETQDESQSPALSSESSPGRRMPQSIKIDALYKPILRRFRSVLRKQFELNHNVKRFQHWTISEFMTQVTKFLLNYVEAPPELLEKDSVDTMLIILFPCIIKKPAYRAMRKSPMFLIFRENNYTLRTRFFSDPLIKFLWKNVFIKKHEDILVTHLRRIRSHNIVGQTKYERFVKDLATNEIKHKITLLPDSIKDDSKMTVFTEEEAFTDLVENGKYNKR